jgi:hypothetical protein
MTFNAANPTCAGLTRTQEVPVKLSPEQLKVTSFETAPRAATWSLPTTGGEDCFSHMAGCPPITRTAAN